MDIAKFVVALGGLLMVISFVLAAVLLLDTRRSRKDASRLIRTKPLKASLRESAELEMGQLERVMSVLPRLYEEGIKPPGESTTAKGEIEWLDSKVQGPLRSHYEDLNFLLDLNEFLGDHHSRAHEEMLCKAYRYASLLAFKYHDLPRAIARIQKLLTFDEPILEKIGLSKGRVLSFLGTAHLYLADEIDKETNLSKGIAALREGYRLRPNPITGYNLAWALDEIGDYESAVGILQDVLARDPGLGSARYNLACGLVKVGRVSDALDALNLVPIGDPVWKVAGKDPDLEPLREARWRERFDQILNERAGAVLA